MEEGRDDTKNKYWVLVEAMSVWGLPQYMKACQLYDREARKHKRKTTKSWKR